MEQQHQESPELVLVASAEVRAAALAALAPATGKLPAAQERERAETVVPQTAEADEVALPLSRHPDLDRFGFLAEVPEREPERSWLRLAWLAALSTAAVLGAAAPVVVALLVR